MQSADTVGAELAYRRVRTAIVENRYPPGQRLVEQRLAEELGLSRTPVREALRMLEAEGLVVSRRNRGAMVRPLSATEVVDLYGLRIRLESYAVEVATERATETELGLHVDTNYYWWHHLRIHVPVQTTPDVVFEAGGESVHMAEGEVWVFDTWQRHRVDNPASSPRIHLVIDAVGSAPMWELIERPDRDPRRLGGDGEVRGGRRPRAPCAARRPAGRPALPAPRPPRLS